MKISICVILFTLALTMASKKETEDEFKFVAAMDWMECNIRYVACVKPLKWMGRRKDPRGMRKCSEQLDDCLARVKTP
ncbi:hypothetical protein ScPMuIL_005064 [Solemya velum]